MIVLRLVADVQTGEHGNILDGPGRKLESAYFIQAQVRIHFGIDLDADIVSIGDIDEEKIHPILPTVCMLDGDRRSFVNAEFEIIAVE